ncbi:MAG: hypothetical protein QOI63_811, partial [Thermoplasmata archaeon]|nr:hypothetical protein [Thermoplasmata archaeon]
MNNATKATLFAALVVMSVFAVTSSATASPPTPGNDNCENHPTDPVCKVLLIVDFAYNCIEYNECILP